MEKVLVVGGSGGIGSAMVKEFRQRYPNAEIVATWFEHRPDSGHPSSAGSNNIDWVQLDATCDTAMRQLALRVGPVDCVVDASGYLHSNDVLPEKSVAGIDPEFFLTNMKKNVLPTLFLAKHFQSNLRDDKMTVFATISAKVGSIGDNRLGGWTSYRCSKAALNMAVKNIAIEWKRRNPSTCVVALHPGTTATNLSKPFQRNVPDSQLFDADRTASFLLDRIESLRMQDSGTFVAFDGEVLPW